MTIGSTYHFDEVFQEEVQQINQRRRELGRTDLVALEIEPDAVSVRVNTVSSEPTSEARPPDASSESALHAQTSTRPEHEPVLRATANSYLVGLAFSGGGIRSASFCLGALQALNKANVLKNIDYLSTVSGGGYIGTSLSAAMTHSRGEFPFESSLNQDEPYPVQHIRNHSNYLFPRGSINVFYNIAIYLRGLLANGLLLLPWLLLAAAITIFVNQSRDGRAARGALVVSRAKSRSARLARASCRSNGGCAGSTVLFLAVYGLPIDRHARSRS